MNHLKFSIFNVCVREKNSSLQASGKVALKGGKTSVDWSHQASLSQVTGTEQGAELWESTGNMNTTDPGINITFPIGIENSTLTTLSSLLNISTSASLSTTPPSFPLPPSYSSDIHDPEFTIMIVLGLSLLLAGVAAFIVVCQPSKRDGDFESDNYEDSFRSRNKSGEPQLKHWKRFGSYRRSYNASFRRPPHRKPESVKLTQPRAAKSQQRETDKETKPSTPCMCDYVTEI
ncbi:hypothetical protein WMY93_018602 [Mugilogobius chulae]|uniref:Uncharacterized protein n=1 Tax=Mugilogobius chulae TaxID=88201 RepID=A0AAW0NKH2_9GOBI